MTKSTSPQAACRGEQLSDVVSSTAGHDQSTSQLDNETEGSYELAIGPDFPRQKNDNTRENL